MTTNKNITINIYNNYSYIYGEIPPEIYEVCTLKRTYFTRKKGEKPKYRVKYYNYLHRNDRRFPAGWTFSKVVPRYKELGYNVLYKDCREPLQYVTLNGRFDLTPRDYQTGAVNISLQKERGIIKHATGSGKTFTAGLILDKIGVPTLYIVPSQLLLYQTAETFSKWFGNDRVGMIGDGLWKPSLITVSTNQTLWINLDSDKFKQLVKNIKCLMVDEAHYINKQRNKKKSYLPGNSFYIIAQKFENARIRLAFTATPGSENSYGGQLLRATTGRILHEINSSDLIKMGFLSKPKIVIYRNEIDISYDEWREAYNENIVNNPERNRKIVDIAKKYANDNKRVLIAVNYVEKHGKVLESMFSKDDKMEAIYGEHDSKYRKAVLNRFKNGDTCILISSIVKVGVDIPEMDVIIVANAGKGGEEHRQLIQLLGRVLRKTEDKNKATVIDFYDGDDSILEKHSSMRLATYRKESEYDVEFR